MARVQKRRLLKLAAYLESLPELYKKPPSRRKTLPGFEMRSWVQTHPLFSDFCGNEPSECGTAACAAGHAPRIPEFRKLGFRMHICRGRRGSGVGIITGWPVYKSYSSFIAVEKFFGLTQNQAELLFTRSAGQHPLDVAATLKAFVKTGQLP